MKKVKNPLKNHPVYGHLSGNHQIFDEADYGSARACYEEGCIYAIRHMKEGFLVSSMLKKVSVLYEKGYSVSKLNEVFMESKFKDAYWQWKYFTFFEIADEICDYIDENFQPTIKFEQDKFLPGKFSNAVDIKEEFISQFLRGYVTTCRKEYMRIKKTSAH